MLNRFSRVQLLCNPMDHTRQPPLSMGLSRQEYWSGLPCPSPGDLPDPVIEPMSLTSPALADRFFTTNATWEAHEAYFRNLKTRFPLIPGWNLTFCYMAV